MVDDEIKGDAIGFMDFYKILWSNVVKGGSNPRIRDPGPFYVPVNPGIDEVNPRIFCIGN